MKRSRIPIAVLLFLFLFCSTAFPQTGPMGIGNKDGTPTSAGPQPKLVLWLDGSSAIPYAQQAPLELWKDKSGNEHHFTPEGLVQRPSLRTEGTFSGPKGSFREAPPRPCLRFINNSTHLVCPNFEFPEKGYSIYFVTKTAQDKFGLFKYSTPERGLEFMIYHKNGIRERTDSLERVSAIGDLSNDEWNYRGILSSGEDGANWEYSKNTAHEEGYVAFDQVRFSDKGEAVIGEIKNQVKGLSSGNFEGFLAEIIIYEGRLSRPATRLLRTYFWIKYGLNGDDNIWDKFNGNMDTPEGEAWGGKYYTPIGIGRETATPNPGSVNEARTFGLVLRVNEGDWTRENTYLCAAAAGGSVHGPSKNSITKDDLSATPTVIERWTRLWEISGDESGRDQLYQIAFDFEEAIGGENPVNPENYVLLHRRDAEKGEFSIADAERIETSGSELIFTVSKRELCAKGPYYTIGTTNVESSLTGIPRRTKYARRSGNWNDPSVWSLDDSSTSDHVNAENALPKLFDDVVIGEGMHVRTDGPLPELSSLRIDGTLDLGTTEQPSVGKVTGSGLIRCARGNFPEGNSADFADPMTGGTLEFYGSGGFTQNSDLAVNRINVHLSSPEAEITLAADLTANGQFTVKQGTWIVGDGSNTPRILTSRGNLVVENSGTILVSPSGGNTKHKWYFYKDFINKGGEVRFTNRSAAEEGFEAYDSNEIRHTVTAFFTNDSSRQRLRADGSCLFSRIVIDKGADEKAVLTISSNDPEHFKLIGACNYPLRPTPFTPAEPFPGNPGNPNSFALISGTAEIRENIFIPLHINNIPPWEDGSVGNYNINNTARLLVNGGEVTKGPMGGPDKGGSGLVVYGKVTVSSGVLNIFSEKGIILRDKGELEVHGGKVNTNSLQTSASNSEDFGGLTITGGTVNLDGNFPGGIPDHRYTLGLTYPENFFRMTGGSLIITGPSASGPVFINCDPENTEISGGTVRLHISGSSGSHKITSRAPFADLILTNSAEDAGAGSFRVAGGVSRPDDADIALPAHDLTVVGDLRIIGKHHTKLEMGTDSTPSDLYLSGNLTVDSGCAYIHHQNTTHFTGSTNSSLNLGNKTDFSFHNVVINKEKRARFVRISEEQPETAVNIHGNLYLRKGRLIRTDRNIVISGDVIKGKGSWCRKDRRHRETERSPDR